MATMIKVSDKLWKALNDLKTVDCKTFEEVIWRNMMDDEYNNYNQLNKGGDEHENHTLDIGEDKEQA